MQSNKKVHIGKSLMVFIQNSLKPAGVTPTYKHPGGQITKFSPKITPNIGIMQITSQFGAFDDTK